MLHRHARGRQDDLQLRDVQPDDDHDESEKDGREEVPVLRLLVEEGRMLEDAQTAVAEGHEVEPLPAERKKKISRFVRKIISLCGGGWE